jgi:signal transduction histidine kinase
MQRAHFIASLLATAALTAFQPAWAQERGSREEAKALVEAAVAHVKKVGADKAYKDFNTDKATWTKKDLYVFAFDMAGNTLAHGANEKLIGKNLSKLVDASGKSTTEAFAQIVKTKGSGWHDYDFAHPVTKKNEGKSSYVQILPGHEAYVGVGIYR